VTGSFLEELDLLAEHLHKSDRKVLTIPGSGGKLGVRYKAPSDENAVTPVVAALKVQGAIDSETAKQFLVDCCDEIVRRNADGEWESRDPENGPLRFDVGDERWGKLPAKATARHCVAKLYNLDVQPIAHIGHADVLFDWLQGLEGEIAARVEGESDGGAASSETPPA
jgi:hypothetical protein